MCSANITPKVVRGKKRAASKHSTRSTLTKKTPWKSLACKGHNTNNAKPKFPWQQTSQPKLTSMGQPFLQGLNLPTHLHKDNNDKHQNQGLDGAYLLPHQLMKTTFSINQGLAWITPQSLVRVSTPNLSNRGTNGTNKMQQLKQIGHHLVRRKHKINLISQQLKGNQQGNTYSHHH